MRKPQDQPSSLIYLQISNSITAGLFDSVLELPPAETTTSASQRCSSSNSPSRSVSLPCSKTVTYYKVPSNTSAKANDEPGMIPMSPYHMRITPYTNMTAVMFHASCLTETLVTVLGVMDR